jgi:hypothetical protein
LHQSDERANNNGAAGKQECWQLKAQRLAKTGGHDDQGVAPMLYQMLNNFPLTMAEKTGIPMFPQYGKVHFWFYVGGFFNLVAQICG